MTVRSYEQLNHLFQPSASGSRSEYATIAITFDERVLEDIVAWIRAKL